MENLNTCLVDKKCLPCQGGVPPLGTEDITRLLNELGHKWWVNPANHLYKEYKFNDFMNSMNFANKVARLAEKEGHHPDLRISWGLCAIEIWTHKINGLSESDFVLAAKIESITY